MEETTYAKWRKSVAGRGLSLETREHNQYFNVTVGYKLC